MALTPVFDPTEIMVYNNSHARTHYSTTRMEIGVRRMKRRTKTTMLSEMCVVIIMLHLDSDWEEVYLVWNEGSVPIIATIWHNRAFSSCDSVY